MHASILRYFSAVADYGSIRQAAEHVGVSPSAVNRQILNLESTLGVVLFERRANGMRITDSGRVVLAHCRSTLHDFDRLRSELAHHTGLLTGSVVVYTLDSVASHFLPDALPAFLRLHPLLNLKVVAVEPFSILQAIHRGDADLGFTFATPLQGSVAILSAVPSPLCAIVSQDHPLSDRTSITLEQCADYPLIFHDDASTDIRAIMGEDLYRFKSLHSSLLSSNMFEFTKSFVYKGMGVAFCTAFGLFRELLDTRLHAIPIEHDQLQSLRLCLFRNADRPPTLAARALSDYLSAMLPTFIERLCDSVPNLASVMRS